MNQEASCRQASTPKRAATTAPIPTPIGLAPKVTVIMSAERWWPDYSAPLFNDADQRAEVIRDSRFAADWNFGFNAHRHNKTTGSLIDGLCIAGPGFHTRPVLSQLIMKRSGVQSHDNIEIGIAFDIDSGDAISEPVPQSFRKKAGVRRHLMRRDQGT